MKRLRTLFFLVTVAFMSAAAIQGCSNNKPDTKYQVSVDRNELSLTVFADQGKFNITSSDKWEIIADGLTGTDGGWYTLSAASGNSDTEITVTVKANNTEEQHIATLSIEGKYNKASMIIKQAADGDDMLDVKPALLTDFDVCEAATQTFAITSPFKWEITFKDNSVYTDPLNPNIDSKWASVDVVKDEGDKTITVTVKNNDTGDARTGEFTIIAAGKKKTVTVNQLADLNNTFDPAFLDWCLTSDNAGPIGSGKIDTNSDGSISKSESEAVTGIECSDKALTSLKGIENFTALAYLSCFNNQLNSLDLKANTALTYLNCSINQLNSLDIKANTALIFLDCSSNSLNSLDLEANKALIYVDCGVNRIISLDLNANTELTNLNCYQNKMESLNLKANTKLAELDCSNNELSSLDLEMNTALTKLNCSTNPLISINLEANTKLAELRCQGTSLTSLDVSKNIQMKELFCRSSPNLVSINITGSSFEKLIKFGCEEIKSGANVYVWSGFKIEDKPTTWHYPADVNWVLP